MIEINESSARSGMADVVVDGTVVYRAATRAKAEAYVRMHLTADVDPGDEEPAPIPDAAT